LDSPLHLWHKQQTLGAPAPIRVYPDFARIAHYTWLATDNRLSQIGVLQRRRRGQGLEFHQLRDYRQDDSPRDIDWSATARARRLIAREYQDERDQQILLVLDCGQRMRARDGAMSHFDHALNALLLLAYVALRQGDAVGVSTFAHDHPRFLPPRKSISTVSRLMHGLFDLQPSLRTPDYLGAATALGRHLTKRALIVVATTIRDEDGSALQEAVRMLRRKHAVIVANLREDALIRAKERPISSLDDALAYAAATDYLERRRRTIAALRRTGVHVVDVAPSGLARHLVNHYWDMKRAGAA
jgi:uncharacterized protein (DUF58 family)